MNTANTAAPETQATPAAPEAPLTAKQLAEARKFGWKDYVTAGVVVAAAGGAAFAVYKSQATSKKLDMLLSQQAAV